MRRHRWNAQRRALGKRDLLRQGRYEIDREGDVLGGRSTPAAIALPIIQPYAPAEPNAIYPCTHLIDDPGAVTVGTTRRNSISPAAPMRR